MKRIAIAVVILLAGFAIALRLIYGGGADFPDRSDKATLPASAIEVVADLPTPPGNIAVSASGRVFVTLHPEARPELKLVEIVDGEMKPWPSASFQNGADETRWFRNVLSLRIDRFNRLWTLDNGHHGIDEARLLAFDLDSGKVVHEHVFSDEIAAVGSHLNDFQVSPDGRTIFIADASFFARRPAIVVYDVTSGTARRVIENHPSVDAEKYTPIVQGRRMVAFGLVAVRPGVDSITLDTRGEWLYFAPITNNHLYRVRAADLTDPTVSRETLLDRIEAFALKTMSDGITIDVDDNIYLSDLEHSAVVKMNSRGELTTLLRDDRIRWPDGFSFGPDGWLYVTCSSLQHVIGKPPSSIAANAPYQVLRFKPGSAGIPGH